MKASTALVAGVCTALLGSLAMVAGCARTETAASSEPLLAAPLPGGLQPEASILDLMLEVVDPNADELWESVAIVSTTTGVEEHHPRTDEEWAVVRRKALLLMESSNLLVVEGRPVARPGQTLAEEGLSDDLTPAQAQAEIDKDRSIFVAFARSMQISAGELLKAIDARDVEAFLEAGGALDEACEGCHRKYWYPNAPTLPGL